MAAIDDIALPDTQLQSSTNQQKFLDLWWRLCSKTGLSKLIAAIVDGVLGHQVAQFGPDWAPTKTVTWLGREVQALPQNFANTQAQVAAVRADIAALRNDLPGLINTAVANAVAAHPASGVDVNAVAEAVFQRFKTQAEK